jgi:glycine cleavage system H protein
MALTRFAKTHEWIRFDGEPTAGAIGTVGISAYAVAALTDLVFMQLPAAGKRVAAGESFGEVESVKAVSDLYAPVSGEIVEVNDSLTANLERLGQDPYGEGWLVRMRIDNPAELDGLFEPAAYDREVGA